MGGEGRGILGAPLWTPRARAPGPAARVQGSARQVDLVCDFATTCDGGSLGGDRRGCDRGAYMRCEHPPPRPPSRAPRGVSHSALLSFCGLNIKSPRPTRLATNMRRNKPTPVDEARAGLHIVEQSLWNAVPKFLRKLSGALHGLTGHDLPVNCAPIHFGSWMGGDRDGNPNVTAAVRAASFSSLIVPPLPHARHARLTCSPRRPRGAAILPADLDGDECEARSRHVNQLPGPASSTHETRSSGRPAVLRCRCAQGAAGCPI